MYFVDVGGVDHFCPNVTAHDGKHGQRHILSEDWDPFQRYLPGGQSESSTTGLHKVREEF